MQGRNTNESANKRKRPIEMNDRDKRRNVTKNNGSSSHNNNTVSNGNPEDSSNPLNKDSDFICKMRFRNTLPAIPFDPKLLARTFDPSPYCHYQHTSLEYNYQHALLTEPDLGISIDLINVDAYKIPNPKPSLAPEDKFLLDPPDATTTSNKSPGTVRRETRPAVSWLRRQTEYIANDWSSESKKPKKKLYEKDETKSDKRNLNDIIKAIEHSFELAQQPPVHPTNPSLKAVEVIPLFPDFDRWSNTYSQMVFDTDPSPEKLDVNVPDYEEQKKEMDELMDYAVIKGFATEVGDQKQSFVSYLLPRTKEEAAIAARELAEKEQEENLLLQKQENIGTDNNNNNNDDDSDGLLSKEDKGKEKENDDHRVGNDGKEIYQWVREYTYQVDRKLNNGYFLVWDHDQVGYNEIVSRMMLDKIKSKAAKDSLKKHGRPSMVIKTKRSLDEDEQKDRDQRIL